MQEGCQDSVCKPIQFIWRRALSKGGHPLIKVLSLYEQLAFHPMRGEGMVPINQAVPKPTD